MDAFGLSVATWEPPKVPPQKKKRSRRDKGKSKPHTEAGSSPLTTSQSSAQDMHTLPQPYVAELESSARSNETLLRRERLRVLAGAGVSDSTQSQSNMPFTLPLRSSSPTMTSTNPSSNAGAPQLQHQPQPGDRTQTRARGLLHKLRFSRTRDREPKWDIAIAPAASIKALPAIPRGEVELQDGTVSEGSRLAGGEAADGDAESNETIIIGYAY